MSEERENLFFGEIAGHYDAEEIRIEVVLAASDQLPIDLVRAHDLVEFVEGEEEEDVLPVRR